MAVPARIGHGEGFAEFYAANAPRIAGLARRYVDESAADDVVQETMLRAYRRGLHAEDRDPWPWLATVARNLCHDAHRRGGAREQPVAEVETATTTTGADQLVEDKVRAMLVAQTLGQLSDAQRRVLIAHHVQGESCAALADEQATTVDGVKSALARARAAFRDRYEGWRSLFPPALAPFGSHAARPGWGAALRGRVPGVAGLVGALMALTPPVPAGDFVRPPTAPEAPAPPIAAPRVDQPKTPVAEPHAPTAPVQPHPTTTPHRPLAPAAPGVDQPDPVDAPRSTTGPGPSPSMSIAPPAVPPLPGFPPVPGPTPTPTGDPASAVVDALTTATAPLADLLP